MSSVRETEDSEYHRSLGSQRRLDPGEMKRGKDDPGTRKRNGLAHQHYQPSGSQEAHFYGGRKMSASQDLLRYE